MEPDHFDEKAANKVIAFIERYCRHSKGKWRGARITLLDWQRSLLRDLFGQKRGNRRRYKRCHLWVPRRNGKTTIMACVALFLLLADGEKGAEIYLLATTAKQAEICWDAIVGMIDQCPAFGKRLQIYVGTKKIIDPQAGGKLQILPAQERNSLVGQNSSAILVDELAFIERRESYTNLRGSMLNREQPLLFTISTASDNLNGIGKEEYDYCAAIRDGRIQDDEVLPVIYEAPPELDWKDPATWRMCNPSINEAFNEDAIRKLCQEAINEPRKQAEFEQFHLNRWIGNAVAWLHMPTWLAAARDFPDLTGKPCMLGFDGARTADLSCYSLCFNIAGCYYFLPKFFVPGAAIREKEIKDKAPYLAWARQGFITLTQGSIISDEEIYQSIKADSKRYDIQKYGYDPLYADSVFNQKLAHEDGCDVVPLRQGMVTMGPPTSAFANLLKAGKLFHPNNPVLNWNVENAVVVSDRNDNIMVAKMHNNVRRKVDGLQASIMALCLSLTAQEDSADILVF